MTFNDDLNLEIAEAIREGNTRMAIRNDEANKAADQRRAEAEAQIRLAWYPIIERLKETIPPWAHQFLSHPMINPQAIYDYEDHNRPAVIRIPNIATVYGYVDGPRIGLLPAQYAVSDDDETWSVIDTAGHPKTFWELEHVNNDFHIALANAAAWEKRLPELQAEADRLNAERQKAKQEWVMIEEPATTEPAFDWLHKARWALGAATADGNESAIAYALIGILEHLRLRHDSPLL
jgi:hypothetical protein